VRGQRRAQPDQRAGARIGYVLGAGRNRLSAAELRHMVPDLAGRDVFTCGRPAS
jgi:hypothetical protein